MDKPEGDQKTRSWVLDDLPKKAASALRRYGNEGWVVNLNNPSNTLLNEVGARIFEMLDGRHSVGDVMTREPVTLGPDSSIELAASTMAFKRVSCLLVVENAELVGIVTTYDLFDALIRRASRGG